MPRPEAQERFFRQELAKELRLVENMMKKTPNIEKKNYYLSAAFGITSRTFRYSFSREVLLADFVLTNAYGIIGERLDRMKIGDGTVEVTKDLFDHIGRGLRQLADNIDNNESVQEALEIILTAAFSTTGPGNYLREKGLLTL